MKGLKLSLVIMAAALLTIGLSGMTYAFHDGGVAYCDGCHTMHNSRNGTRMTINVLPVGTANTYLLQGQDQSSTCLNCHGKGAAGGYHVYDPNAGFVGTGTPALNFTPGGDFAWLKKDYAWTTPRAGTSPGKTHGHNVIAADFGLGADDRFPTGAPGGTYPQSALGCQSCHDPHGKTRIIDAAGSMATPAIGSAVLPIAESGSYGAIPTATSAVGVYRLLGGQGYYPKSAGAGFAFTANPPIAVAPDPYNQEEHNNYVRVAYGSGMSSWCSNCHTGLHNDAYPTNLRHPTDLKLTSVEIANYNAYKMSGDLTGTVATSYTSLVPFEEGSSDRAILATHASSTGGYLVGADANSKVTCVTCHRAHTSAWDSAGRWNFRATFITEDGAYPAGGPASTESQGRLQPEWQAGMYNRLPSAFATYQRSLCNKCHAKD